MDIFKFNFLSRVILRAKVSISFFSYLYSNYIPCYVFLVSLFLPLLLECSVETVLTCLFPEGFLLKSREGDVKN